MRQKIVNADSDEGQLVGEGIVEAVENQLKDNDPPEVKNTLKRLMKIGESRENAMRFIASVLSVEIFGVIKNNQPFNEKRYVNNLKQLPKLPFDDE
ncbi:MAG: hypothetical protein DRQ44_10725 [Gammaproteobacteria bacterium]|nr:MAG: hypothetical protein DRQ44_10725 [Gammaproteobacteria bacterium]